RRRHLGGRPVRRGRAAPDHPRPGRGCAEEGGTGLRPPAVAGLRRAGGHRLLEHRRPDGQGRLYADNDQWFELADFLRSAEPFKGLTAEWKRKNGTTTVVRISGRSVTNGGDGGVVFELFAEDVTERRLLEEQLRQSQKMEAVGRLAGGIAHDFNNLLMVISGYSEFLLERLGDEPQLRGPAQEIASAAERASSLTRQLLAFSRKQMLAPRIVNLNDVATENIKMLTRMIGEDIDLVMVPS